MSPYREQAKRSGDLTADVIAWRDAELIALEQCIRDREELLDRLDFSAALGPPVLHVLAWLALG